MDQLKVSIITVCFNSAKTIEQTIKSVIGQSYQNMEYIIIDGGSNDATVDIIKKYQDKLAYWVSEPDRGIYDAMNKGLDKATGDVIGIINSDDWYGELTFEHVINTFLDNAECEIVYGDVVYVREDGALYAKYNAQHDFKKIWYEMPFAHPTCFIRKTVYESLGGFSCQYKVAADIELLLRFYIAGKRFCYAAGNIAYFRFGGVSDKNTFRGFKEVKDISVKYGYNIIAANYFYFVKCIKYGIIKCFTIMGFLSLLDKWRGSKHNVSIFK